MSGFTCWWKEGIVYQIYPRSFQDTNGDGIGDIKGIISRLDHLTWLGVSALWISPIYKSPMYDYGYDISDYRTIDPAFGTKEDVLELIEQAHARNLRIIFDMVLNHTSHQHRWFVESSANLQNPKRDFYIWQDSGKKKPNNWLAAFGGSAWTIHKETNQFYMHSFLKEQPDLNWRNPAVVEALFGEVAHWLDMGVDGFRLDVINLIVKDEALRDNPPRVGETIRPYDMQNHLYDRNQPLAHIRLKAFRKLLEKYQERMLVGEIMVDKPGEPQSAAAYLGNGIDELHLAFDFSFMWVPWKACAWRNAAKRWYSCIPALGWPCWVLSNHDVVRAITRFGDNQFKARLASLFLFTQQGTPFIYYGEEIGMKDKRLPRKSIQDPVGKRYWPFHPGRDGQRRPMQWDDTFQAGFSSGTPWLPLHADFHNNSVEKQQKDQDSLLNLYKSIIAIRNNDPVLRLGLCEFILEENSDVLCYTRRYQGQSRLILLNFSKGPKKISKKTLAQECKVGTLVFLIATDNRQLAAPEDETILLNGYQGILYSCT